MLPFNTVEKPDSMNWLRENTSQTAIPELYNRVKYDTLKEYDINMIYYHVHACNHLWDSNCPAKFVIVPGLEMPI